MGLSVCGVVLLASQACVAYLSSSFVFGIGHAERPIPTFLVIEVVAFVAYLVAVEIVRRSAPRPSHFVIVVAVAIACRAVLAPGGMIQEVDAYRYVWDGQAVLQGANPYVLAPQQAHEAGTAPAVHPSAAVEHVFARIGYPDVPTIYPPVAQGLFALGQALTPWRLGGWQLLVFAAEALAVVLLAAALLHLGRPLAWTIVYAWSPLALKELANSLHLDAFVVLGLAGLVYAVLRGRLLAAFVALAWITMLKLFAVALVPVVAAYAWRCNPRRAVWGIAVFVALICLAYAPWARAGGKLFEGLLVFARLWQRNDSLFSLVSAVAGEYARPICGVLIVAVVTAASQAVFRAPDRMRALAGSLVVVVAIFLLAPTSNPWYFTWSLPFLVLFPSRALLLLSGLLFLYYAEFHFIYRDQPERFDLVRVFEYVPFYMVLVLELWQARRAGRPGWRV